jgi:hypothetical protein
MVGCFVAYSTSATQLVIRRFRHCVIVNSFAAGRQPPAAVPYR